MLSRIFFKYYTFICCFIRCLILCIFRRFSPIFAILLLFKALNESKCACVLYLQARTRARSRSSDFLFSNNSFFCTVWLFFLFGIGDLCLMQQNFGIYSFFFFRCCCAKPYLHTSNLQQPNENYVRTAIECQNAHSKQHIAFVKKKKQTCMWSMQKRRTYRLWIYAHTNTLNAQFHCHLCTHTAVIEWVLRKRKSPKRKRIRRKYCDAKR